MNTYLASWMTDLLFIIVISLIGAIVKDVYNTLTNKEAEVKILRILISTIISSIILFSLSDIILTKLSLKLFIMPCFFGGMIGFELMGYVTKLNFWVKVFQKMDKIVKVLKDGDNKENNNDNKN